jgi:hypothetical protein
VSGVEEMMGTVRRQPAFTQAKEDTMRDNAVRDEARFDSPLRLWIAIWQRQIANARP